MPGGGVKGVSPLDDQRDSQAITFILVVQSLDLQVIAKEEGAELFRFPVEAVMDNRGG